MSLFRRYDLGGRQEDLPPTKHREAIETPGEEKERAKTMTGVNETTFIRSIKHESFRITMEQRQREWAIRQKENYSRFRAKVVRDEVRTVSRSKKTDD